LSKLSAASLIEKEMVCALLLLLLLLPSVCVLHFFLVAFALCASLIVLAFMHWVCHDFPHIKFITFRFRLVLSCIMAKMTIPSDMLCVTPTNLDLGCRLQSHLIKSQMYTFSKI